MQSMAAPYSKVRRGGVAAQIRSEDIVPGDIVILETGDTVPADMRLIASASLRAEEAALTGESHPVDKNTDALEAPDGAQTPLGSRTNMAYMGTSVTYGHGEGVVTATGMHTEMGKNRRYSAQHKGRENAAAKKAGGLQQGAQHHGFADLRRDLPPVGVSQRQHYGETGL